jgi:hypothetical protein
MILFISLINQNHYIFFDCLIFLKLLVFVLWNHQLEENHHYADSISEVYAFTRGINATSAMESKT